MYLIKSVTLEGNSHTVIFDLYTKDGEPILVEEALESNGSRVGRAYVGKEEIFERLWRLDLLCDGEVEVRGLIHDIKQCLIDYLYGE